MPPKAKVWLITAMAAVIGNDMVAPSAIAQSARQNLGFADYGICQPDTIDVPLVLKGSPEADQGQQQTNAVADQVQSLDNDEVEFNGNVQIVQGRQGVFADQVVFNRKTRIFEAAGNVKYYTPNGDELNAKSAEIEMDTFVGTAHNAGMRFVDHDPVFDQRQHTYFEEDYSMFAPFTKRTAVARRAEDRLPAADPGTYVRARATAASVDFKGGDYQLMHDAVLTNCEEGNRSVELVAKQIELDHVRGTGTGKSMTVKFKGVPILYFPILSFPINDQRKTGFLSPGYGYEEKSGLILEAPYYINIAPRFDATVTPRILANRGNQLYGEFRYLTENSYGSIRGEFLPSDDVFDEQDRYAASINHKTRLGKNWDLDVDFQDVSDSRYLSDFSSDVDLTSTTYILQKADLRYYGDAIDFKVKASAYKRVNDNVSIRRQPYERLPQAELDLKEIDLGPFRFEIDSEYTKYVHDDTTRVDGARLRIKPHLSLPLERIYGHLTPEFSIQSISYDLENNPTGDDSPSVAVPIFSVDSGLIFERFFKRSDNVFMQTLEPRLYYVNIPDKLEQEDFPDFDTGGGSTSSFSHFFRENRFFGGDRVGDTHQISLGLTSRIVDDDTGKERFKLSLGQVFFLDDREVGLSPDSPAQTESRSDFLAETSASLNKDWRVRSFARWSADQNELEYISVSTDYDHSRRRNASIGYSQTTDVSKNLTFDFDLPVSDRWQLEADVRYALRESELRSATLGISYDGCCWAAKIETQRYPDGRGELKNRFMVVFELDDLGQISTQSYSQ